ncbi:MAG: InlB B-repeat-containing protein [Bacteroidaceae bacterium]|nr:InlB B-repeat-containing protein [Bacteroidaceae bacterium]
MLKKTLNQILTAMLFSCYVWAAPTIWDGTADISWYTNAAQSYNLTTAEQLAGLAQLVNDGTSDFYGKTITLGADIFLNDTTGAGDGSWINSTKRVWTPIGTYSNPFRGEFDGLAGRKNRKIYGIYINTSDGYQGFFGRVDGTKVSNLDLLVGEINAGNYVGSLIGYGGNITNIYSEVVVKGNDYVGGVLGYGATVVKSSYVGNVTGKNYVGGLAGYSSKVSGTASAQSFSKGEINGRNYVGGVVGFVSSNVSDSYSESFVKCDSNYVGGIAGYAGNIINSVYHVNGDVSGENYVGGIVGYTISEVSNAYSEGVINGNMDFVGGVVGYTSASVSECFHKNGNVVGKNYVGGLIGMSYYGHNGSSKKINATYKSFAEANVVGNNYVGGLIGLDSLYNNSQTYAITKYIQSSYSKGDVKGVMYVGGIAGKINKGLANSSLSNNTSISLDSCYHTDGDVSGLNDFVGGLTGYISGTISHSYHDEGYISGKNFVGCLVGRSDSTIQKSHSACTVKGVNYIGGIAGSATDLDSVYHVEGDVLGNAYVGGIAGWANTIKGSYSEGLVEGESDFVGGVVGQSYDELYFVNHIRGDIIGNNFVGGIVGLAGGGTGVLGSLQGHGLIKNAYSEGDVKGNSNYVGGIVGFINITRSGQNPSISNSYHKNGVVYGQNYVGGLAGYSYYRWQGPSSNTKMVAYRSYAEADVRGNVYVGGLIGLDSVADVKSESPATKIAVSYSKGNISGSEYVGGIAGCVSMGMLDSVSHLNGKVIGSDNYIGGIAGFAFGPITNSQNIGEVSGVDKIGGIVGVDSSYIENSYSEGSIRGRNYVGGIAGYLGFQGKTFSIRNSYFDGDSVTGIFNIGGLAGYSSYSTNHSFSTAHVKGDDNVGGLIGTSGGTVSNSYALGNVVGDIEHSSAGNDNIGGLVGYAYGNISKSFALGDIEGTTKVGGLVGRFEGTSITNSYAAGRVTGRYEGDPADQNGNLYIGGLVGVGKGTIENTYSSGIVVGDENDPLYTGCLVGAANASMTIKNSYYDATVCSKLSVTGDEDGYVAVIGTPSQNTVAMKEQNTYSNWDFTNTWKIMDGTYPFLLIYANSISNAVVTTEPLENLIYDGNKKTPGVTSVSLFGETLTFGTDYTVSYINNTNAGNASIKVCGAGSYSGCKNILFEIKPIAITPTIAEIANVTFNGNEQKPSISVYNGESLLDANSYSVIYSSNVNAGFGKVEISLIGNYSGSAQSEFIIEKATPVIKTIPVASDLTLGETLASAVLSGGTADVDGNFVWKDATVVPSLENEGFEVIFTPMDSENYKSSEPMIVPVTVIEKVMVVVKVGSLAIEEVLIPKGTSYTLPPSRDSTGYDFVGWYSGNELLGSAGTSISIVQDIEISAKYAPKKYFITFANYDGTSLLKTAVDYGVVPDYIGETPTRPTTAKHTYTFAKWSPSIVKVSGEATYTAVYDSVVNEYVITFVDENGSVLKMSSVAYGVKPVAPSDPTKEASAQYTYSFAGWSPTITTVTGKTTYKATYSAKVNSYTVTFVDDDGRILKTSSVAYGTKPTAPMNPTKSSTEKYNYTFAKWDPAIVSVTGEATYRVVYDSSDVIYTIKFANYDGTILQSTGLQYNELPKYSGKEPSRPSTAQYTYTFVGWDSEIAKVTKSVTYKAIYDSTVNEYVVTFVDEDGAVLKTSSVAYGVKPVAPSNPTKESSAQYTYSFAGWFPTITTVTGKTTYKATYRAEVNSYTITFVDDDGKILKTSWVAYGTKPTAPVTPTKSSTEKYNYTFAGWSPAIEDVTGPATYTALFDSTLNSYSIIFKNGTETLQSTSIAYGSKPEYKGTVPTRTASAKYSYTFVGWNPAIENVTAEAIYTALFDSTLNSYTVVFMNGTTMLQNGSIAYGEMPEYNGTEPSRKATDKYSFKFTKWSPAIESVTQNVTYEAIFDSTEIIKSSSSSKPESSSSEKIESSSSSELNALVATSVPLRFHLSVSGRNIQIAGASVGVAYALFDMQGRVLQKGRAVSANFDIAVTNAGRYLVRIDNQIRNVNVR